MFGQESQPQDQKPFTMSEMVSLISMGCHIWSLPLELILRRHFGSRYIDGFLFLAALWPILFAALIFPEYSFDWTWWAFWIVLVLGICHRLEGLRLDRKGIVRHSRYGGYPFLCRFVPFSEETCKRCELLLVMFISMLTAAISPSLMLFLFGGCLASAVKQGLMQLYRENELIDMRDAQIEQESLAERFRDDPSIF